ncbi:MAG TPA: cytidylate kinase-like family protein [Planctomycetaceae bacterium]|nr:cytidylate kinase-like family protein [Planctomycetaceae bacterium]HIQ21872.1 cytidylate kinase-like family protein [Planctomycetota bacterium]
MKDQTREDPKILKAAEQQMRAWELAQRSAARSVRAHGPQEQLGHYLTISRESGAGGSSVARLVGQRLGWEVMDKNLLDCVAERYRLSREGLEMVDETTVSWAYDLLGAWLDQKTITREQYMVRLARVVVAMARRGNVVFVGRGTQFLLPRQFGLAVRLVAPEPFRIRRVMEREKLDADEAKRYVQQTDRGRRDFTMKFFHVDLAEPHLYDMVINTERFGLDGAAEMIVAAVRQCDLTGRD